MSREHFNDDCPGCRPCIIDPSTGRLFGPDSKEQKAINEVWRTTTRTQREAFHRVTCLNSRDAPDLAIITPLMEKVGAALRK